MKSRRSLIHNRSGAAGAEMALIAPLLITLLFGSLEVGKYFLDEHTVEKAVRDGARYAARQTIDNYIDSSSGCLDEPPVAVSDAIKNLVRTGTVDGTGPNRLSYWTDNTHIDVSSECSATADSQDMKGIYAGITHGGAPVGAPVVTITVDQPYTAMFGLFAFRSSGTLNARQQAVVSGV